jgi:hypothetical protein
VPNHRKKEQAEPPLVSVLVCNRPVTRTGEATGEGGTQEESTSEKRRDERTLVEDDGGRGRRRTGSGRERGMDGWGEGKKGEGEPKERAVQFLHWV